MCDHEVDRDARHEEVVCSVKVKPLPISRMMLTTRLVVRGRGREPQPQSSACRHARLQSSTAAVRTGALSSQPQTAAASCGSALVRDDSKVVAFTPLDSSHHLLLRCCLSSNHQPAIDPTACIPPAASKTPDGTPAPAARQPHDQCQPRAGRRERGRRHSEARDHAFFGHKNVRYLRVRTLSARSGISDLCRCVSRAFKHTINT